MAMPTQLAMVQPLLALLLFLWIVAGTPMLSLIARSSRKPERRAILSALAAASFGKNTAGGMAAKACLSFINEE